jgi:ribonuclease Z
MDIIFLGTSGHGITNRRSLPALIIDKKILLDCGEGTVSALNSNQIPVKNIKHIFLSHLHADHWMGLISLLWQIGIYEQCYPAPKIYVPIGMKAHIEAILDHSFSPLHKLNFDPEISELSIISSSLELENYSISWIQVQHDPICYAYKFNNEIIFSGDTGPCKALNSFIKEIPRLVHEATMPDSYTDFAHKVNHSTPIDCAKIAKSAGVKKLYLYHLPDISEEQEMSFISDAQTIFSSIHILHDNERI